jgi:hypothetical protein
MHRTKIICLLIIFLSAIYMIGCHQNDMTQNNHKKEIPKLSISQYLNDLEEKDYHELSRSGNEIFKTGHHIVNHRNLFSEFPRKKLDNGVVCYDLLLVNGLAGSSFIYLFIDDSTGKVMNFTTGEAIK